MLTLQEKLGYGDVKIHKAFVPRLSKFTGKKVSEFLEGYEGKIVIEGIYTYSMGVEAKLEAKPETILRYGMHFKFFGEQNDIDSFMAKYDLC